MSICYSVFLKDTAKTLAKFCIKITLNHLCFLSEHIIFEHFILHIYGQVHDIMYIIHFFASLEYIDR